MSAAGDVYIHSGTAMKHSSNVSIMLTTTTRTPWGKGSGQDNGGVAWVTRSPRQHLFDEAEMRINRADKTSSECTHCNADQAKFIPVAWFFTMQIKKWNYNLCLNWHEPFLKKKKKRSVVMFLAVKELLDNYRNIAGINVSPWSRVSSVTKLLLLNLTKASALYREPYVQHGVE